MSGYRTLKISDETALDLVRAIYLAREANRREGNCPASDAAEQAEAVGRICREWSAITLPNTEWTPELQTLCAQDWQCPCGATGLNAGLLRVRNRGALCTNCLSSVAPEGS